MQQDYHTEIRVFMIRHALSIPKISRRLGISTSYVFQVLHSKRPAKHIRQRLILELGFPSELIEYRPDTWPKRKAA